MKPRRADGRTALVCPCGRPTAEPRKGLCPRCYQHAYHGRAVGPACEGCGHTDRRTLVRRTLGATPATVCGNCAAIVGRRRLSLAELRAELGPAPRDRRKARRRTPVERRHSGPGWSGAADVVDDRRLSDRRLQ